MAGSIVNFRGTERERFDRKYEIDANGCWLWTAQISANGYGRFSLAGEQRPAVSAHGWSYKHFVGPIPEGLDLDHLCHDPRTCAGGPSCIHRRCVNPGHLKPATRSENVKRGCVPEILRGYAREKAARPACAHGHAYTPENTYRRPDTGTRMCRTCLREQKRSAWNAKRLATHA